ncbi:hypothetical protein [Streptomyces neyagawaensis]|uniref:Uncharacterized protein n=1 Tax=Streptomyces neyagawaensis TaxID=42238 RepID=A0ABV3B2H2_9ACTN
MERIRGTFETGITKLDVLVERSDHTQRRQSAAEAATAALAARVTSLERRVWTASGVAGALGAAGGFFAAYLNG